MKKLLKKFIPDWLLNVYHWKLALIGALVFGFPSRKLKVIGVTGTKGKSTVVVLAGKVLAEAFNTSPQPSPSKGEGEIPPNLPFTKGGGKHIGWISSLTINDGKKEVINPYHMTMPGRFFVQKTLRQMVKNGCGYALVEVTSEGIKQYRHKFIKWAGAVFTNLAPEHIEAHGSFEKYKEAKLKLFETVAKNKESFGVYNLDDENVGHFLAYGIKSKYGFRLKNNFQYSNLNFQSIFNISSVQLKANSSEFAINGIKFETNLLGEFNVYNCVAAAAVGVACGVPLEEASRALAKIQSIPGRLEIIDEGQDFRVVVDLAHTPDSFKKVFGLFGELKKQNLPHPTPLLEKEREISPRIIAVFGAAGGGRDKWKRPELGRIAAENSDIVILTNEDPYDENPTQILSRIKSGISNDKMPMSNVYEIADRRQAIAKGLLLAQAGDIVLILGKGTEQTMVVGNKKLKWDDREVVREEIRKI